MARTIRRHDNLGHGTRAADPALAHELPPARDGHAALLPHRAHRVQRVYGTDVVLG